MKTITPGHTYELANFEQTDREGQILRFIHKAPVKPGSTTLQTLNDGTTTEDVLAALIDRLAFLQAKFPCRENAIALTKLDEALLWLNKRTADRKARAVEGTNHA